MSNLTTANKKGSRPQPGSPAGTGFLWGAATASHQVEGGNQWNDWWEFETTGRLPHQSGEACKHYQLYEQDFDLAKSLGHNAHRLSIEWSRLEPRQGEWNEDAVEHYRAVLMALRERGIEPVVTLHHFTNPAWFARAGGWTHGNCVAWFERYVERVTAALGDMAKFWLTINEPTVYVKHAYVAGDWPPCTSRDWRSALKALRNMARAHRAAYAAIHRQAPDALVGYAHSTPYVVACNPSSPADRLASYARDFVLNRAFLALLGRDPGKVLDFIGVNYYTRQVVRWKPALSPAILFGSECTDDHHGPPRRFSPLGWEVFPEGIRNVLHRFSRYGLPLMVTENGVATDDEKLRLEFLEAHVSEVTKVAREGVEVLGYLYWTLLDNYEWAEGTSARFGLVGVDFSDQRRTVRPAAERFKEIILKQSVREHS